MLRNSIQSHPSRGAWIEIKTLCGAILSALAAILCFSLGHSSIECLLLPLCLLAIEATAILLLKWEHYDRTTYLAMLLPIGAAFLIRTLFLSHATLDYQDFLFRWVTYLRDNGGFRALADDLYGCNYNVPYLYMLAFLTYLPISDLYGIKFFSILFDVLLAWGGLRLARRLGGDRAGLAAFASLLLLPTVILNGACWGQCDSVWAALCVLALTCALENRPWLSLSLLGLAFAFKLQAIFIIPLWLALLIGRKIQFQHLLAFPAAFLAAILPALLLGKPLGDILGVYVGQASDSASWAIVNFNSPSVFSLFPLDVEFAPDTPKYFIAAAFVCMAVVLALLLWHRKEPSDTAYLLAGAALSLGIPFFLPYMHERYFFLGGVLLVVWACTRPKDIPAAGAAELASLGGYHAYLMTRYVFLVRLFGFTWTQLCEGVLMAGALIVAVVRLARLPRDA